MIKRITLIWSVLALGAVLAGCSAIREDNTQDGPGELRFTASVGSFQVKATDTAFERGDAVGLFADAPINARNVRMDWDGASLVPEQKVFWIPGQERTTFFTAYYPYSADVTDTRARFCVNADQSTHELFTASDLMVARTATVSNGTVNLGFRHVLSKLVISIENNLEGAEIADVYLSGVYGRYEASLASELFDGNVLDNPGTIKAGKVTAADGSTAWTVIIPQQYVNPTLIVTTTDGRQYTGYSENTIGFISGFSYTALSVLDGESVLTDFTSEVTEWTDNNDIAFPGYGGGATTIADVIAGPEGEQYTVTGHVTYISNIYYGNYFIADETGELFIYGTVDAEGMYPGHSVGWYSDSFGLVPGDVVTVSGPKGVYNGLPELVDVQILDADYVPVGMLNPGAVGISAGYTEFPVDLRALDGDFYLSNIPDWISIVGYQVKGRTGRAEWYEIICAAEANPSGSGRYGYLEFCDYNGTCFVGVGVNQEAGESVSQGSVDNPYSASQALTIARALGAGEVTPEYVYVEGIVSRVRESFTDATQYGNATFWISDDGSENEELYVYRTRYFGGRAWTASDIDAQSPDIKVGDYVILYTPLTNYGGNTPETVTSQCRMVAIEKEDGYYINLWLPEIVELSSTWYTGPGWGGGLEPVITEDKGAFSILIPEGIGGEEWMGQNMFVLSHVVAPDAGTENVFSCMFTSMTGGSTVATVKLSQFGDDGSVNSEILYNGDVAIGPQYTAYGLTIPTRFTDCPACFVDLGRCEGGDTVTFSNVSWVFHIPYGNGAPRPCVSSMLRPGGQSTGPGATSMAPGSPVRP